MADKKIKTTEVEIRDFYGDKCLGDSTQRGGGVRGKPEGYVEIYEENDKGEKQLVGRHNLVLYQGREQLAQRMVNTANSEVTSTKDEFVTWFGLGDGGVLTADPLDPIPPILTDTELYSLAMINATDSTCADYNTADSDHPEDGYYKHPFDSVEFEQDSMNDDSWLVVKITTVIGVDDANDYQLSEAGLYTAESPLGGYSGQFTLFSRVTFPSLIKTEDRRLIFRWFLYV
jgi:hypothetical protein